MEKARTCTNVLYLALCLIGFVLNVLAYFGSQSVYKAQSFLHRLMPSALCGNIFVFVKKP